MDDRAWTPPSDRPWTEAEHWHWTAEHHREFRVRAEQERDTLRQQLEGAVDTLREIARRAADAPMEDLLSAGELARAALDRIDGGR